MATIVHDLATLPAVGGWSAFDAGAVGDARAVRLPQLRRAVCLAPEDVAAAGRAIGAFDRLVGGLEIEPFGVVSTAGPIAHGLVLFMRRVEPGCKEIGVSGSSTRVLWWPVTGAIDARW